MSEPRPAEGNVRPPRQAGLDATSAQKREAAESPPNGTLTALSLVLGLLRVGLAPSPRRPRLGSRGDGAARPGDGGVSTSGGARRRLWSRPTLPPGSPPAQV